MTAQSRFSRPAAQRHCVPRKASVRPSRSFHASSSRLHCVPYAVSVPLRPVREFSICPTRSLRQRDTVNSTVENYIYPSYLNRNLFASKHYAILTYFVKCILLLKPNGEGVMNVSFYPSGVEQGHWCHWVFSPILLPHQWSFYSVTLHTTIS